MSERDDEHQEWVEAAERLERRHPTSATSIVERKVTVTRYEVVCGVCPEGSCPYGLTTENTRGQAESNRQHHESQSEHKAALAAMQEKATR